jgi:hypothetical protein
MSYKIKRLDDHIDLLRILMKNPVLKLHGLVMPDYGQEDALGMHPYMEITVEDPDFGFFLGQRPNLSGMTMTVNEAELCEKTRDITVDGWLGGEMSTIFVHTHDTIVWWRQNRGKKSRKSELFLVDTMGRSWKIEGFLGDAGDGV